MMDCDFKGLGGRVVTYLVPHSHKMAAEAPVYRGSSSSDPVELAGQGWELCPD